MIKLSILIGVVSLSFFEAIDSTFAENYTPPNPRAEISLDSSWQFLRADAAGAQKIHFADANWTTVNLPHTWNNLDGEDGNTNYYRGVGWYRTHFQPVKKYSHKQFFLKFDGAFLITDVYVNGHFLGEHQGGFAAFTFDATKFLKIGADNVIAVKVNNAPDSNIPPLSADFTFFGGLYRDVHLLVTDPVQISPLDFGSAGIFLKTTGVNSNSANLQVTAVLSNATARAQTIFVRNILTDAATNVVAILTNVVTVFGNSATNVVATTIILQPHLWDGLNDPYLYQAFTEIWRGSKLVDVVAQPVGFRFYRVDPDEGFFLNGRHYDLHGVSMHQDWMNRGWAISRSEQETNFILLKEIGATAVRLSHYENSDYIYQLADKYGIVVWTEIPVVNHITESPEFYANAKQQLTELIRQRYNHPSIICWGIFNEITLKPGPKPVRLAQELADLAASEDSTRPSTSAANARDGEPSNWCSKLNAINKYFGWYNGALEDFAPWADTIHSNYPDRCIGVSEYGAGASIYQHSEEPLQEPKADGNYHPEEYENLFHETYWQALQARPWIWCKFVWNMFDFAVAGRNEGDKPGRNDKGLVTYDRQTCKDAFYFYKANWNSEPMVYITGHTFTNRMVNAIAAKVYANCDSVELFLNGISQHMHTSTNCIYVWPVTLLGGKNSIQAIGTKGGIQVTDSLAWITPSTAVADRILPSVTANNTASATMQKNN